jgi:hypothetical protein
MEDTVEANKVFTGFSCLNNNINKNKNQGLFFDNNDDDGPTGCKVVMEGNLQSSNKNRRIELLRCGIGENILEGGGAGEEIIKEQDNKIAPKPRIVIQSSYSLVLDRGRGLAIKRSKGGAMGNGLLRLWKRIKRMGDRRKRITNSREGSTIKSTLCLIDDILSLYRVNGLGGMMSSITNALGCAWGEGKAYANALCNKMDDNSNTIARAARASCTSRNDDHPPIIDCDLVPEHIFGAEGMIDHDIKTLTYLALCDAGIAHHLVGRFGNGCVEDWICCWRWWLLRLGASIGGMMMPIIMIFLPSSHLLLLLLLLLLHLHIPDQLMWLSG